MKLTVFFCLLASFSFGQIQSVHRYSERPDIATKAPLIPMKFNLDQDTAYVSIYADSLTTGYDVRLSVYFPKAIAGYSVVIGFPDNTFIMLEQVITRTNYAEFAISTSALERLKYSKFDFISFETTRLSEPCTRIKTKDFFTNFLKTL